MSQDNWDYPNRALSTYFMTSNCIHTTCSRSARFLTIVPYGWNSANSYNIKRTADKLFLQEFVSNVCNDLWARYNHDIREHGYKVCFRVRVWTATVEDIVVGPYLLPDRLANQRYRDFLETVLPELLEDLSLAVWERERVVVSARRSSSALWGWRPAVAESRTLRADCMTSYVAGSNSDELFPMETPERACSCSHFQGYQRSRGRTSSRCDNGRCQHVQACSRKWRVAHCRLPSNVRILLKSKYEAAKFDKLIACAIWLWHILYM
jgi:hypothetical protein